MRTMRLLSSFLFLFLHMFYTSTSVKAQAPVISKTIVVGTQGQTNFNSIQSAIDSVPFGNTNWIKIHVQSGVYQEKVVIPAGKGYIFIEGEGRDKTSIESSSYVIFHTRDLAMQAQGLEDTATFSSFADNVVVKYIYIKNVYTERSGIISRALASFINGDKTSFYGCGFSSVQDTLCDMEGRHYFEDCYIEGSVDYIFGIGQSIYEKCEIYSNNAKGRKSSGWITAQGRSNSTQTNGFVFKYCVINGRGSSYLGRAWGPYSRVIFYKTWMSGIVVPQGWDSWNFKGQESNLFYGENGCIGPGSNLTGRVSWMKNVSGSDMMWLTSGNKFIDQEGWLSQQP